MVTAVGASSSIGVRHDAGARGPDERTPSRGARTTGSNLKRVAHWSFIPFF